MKRNICHDVETGLPAADVWEVYGSLLFRKLMPQLFPVAVSKVEVVQGDGGVGTVLRLTFPPGTPGKETLNEKFTKVDHENYVKETLVSEGGFLDDGSRKYKVRIEIVGKEDKTSIIRATVEYEVDHENAKTPAVLSIEGLDIIGKAITKYVKEAAPK